MLELGGEEFSENVASPRGRGRPELVSISRLRANRDRLSECFDRHWGEIAGFLLRFRNQNPPTLAEVAAALQPVRDFCDVDIVRLLLTALASDGTEKLSELLDRFGRATEHLASCVQNAELKQKLGHALTWIRGTGVMLRVRVDNRRKARTCQSQLVEFCKSKRYRIAPENLAAALAGLPEIEYRQSIKRLVKCTPSQHSTAYDKCLILKRHIAWDKIGSERVEPLRQWLRAPTTKVTPAIANLRDDWCFVRTAVHAVDNGKGDNQQHALEALQLYGDHKRTASPTEREQARKESLIPKKRSKIKAVAGSPSVDAVDEP